MNTIRSHSIFLGLAIAGAPLVLADLPPGNPQSVGGTIAAPFVLLNADASRVNEDGCTVGVLHEDELDSAILWSYPRTVRIGTLGGSSSAAYAINDGGTIVGQSDTDKVDRGGRIVSQAFVWDGTMQNLSSDKSWLDSAALGINNAGQIVGWNMIASGAHHAAYWPPVGNSTGQRAMIDLGTLGGENSIARAINSTGVVVGETETEIFTGGVQPVLAFRYDAKSGMQSLPSLPEGVNSGAFDINDSGAIVGWCESMGREPHATLWLPDHAPIDLGTFGGITSRANAINNRGWVVGTATVPVPNDMPGDDRGGAVETIGMPVERAFLYRDGKMTDLNSLLPANSGWLLFEASDITDAGIIVGTGMFDGGPAAFQLDLRTSTPARKNPIGGTRVKLAAPR